MSAFSQFFEEQTGKKWEDRLDGQAPQRKTDSAGDALPLSEGWYYFEENTSIISNFLREAPQVSGAASGDGDAEPHT